VWDDLFGRTFPTRYEPVLIFELRQPLLRDAWEQVNLAGVNVARLNYEAALLGFREKAEEVSAGVIAAYWRLAQAQRDVAIQHALLDQTLESLHKVEGRRDIDATDVQIKQAEAYVKSREAMLLEMRKRVTDVQDLLTRLMADPQSTLTSDVSIVPAAEPQAPEELPELAVVSQSALALAMQRNPSIERARFGVEVAQINLEKAAVQAQITQVQGEAKVQAEFAVANEKALGEKLRASVFQNPATLAELTFVDKLNPGVGIRIIHAGEGTLWTDLKTLAPTIPVK
jgi:hypothetical protein